MTARPSSTLARRVALEHRGGEGRRLLHSAEPFTDLAWRRIKGCQPGAAGWRQWFPAVATVSGGFPAEDCPGLAARAGVEGSLTSAPVSSAEPPLNQLGKLAARACG